MKMRSEHVVPLSRHSISILKHIKQLYPSQQYVFHSGNSSKPIRDNALLQALYWLGYKSKMTVHGFRALASTLLNEHSFRFDVIERQLAHAESNQVRRAYNRAQYMPERIEMMTWWSNYLNKITPFITADE
jgi:integrase